MSDKILIVDDSEYDLMVLKNIFSDYEVFTARNGSELWEIMKTVFPSIILLDVIMPGEDGFEIARKLSSIPDYSDIPIIFISARDDGSDVVEGFDSGAFDYIKKPFDRNELLVRTKSAIKIKHYEQELKRKTMLDPLTGVYNRRYFFDIAMKKVDHYKRTTGSNFALAIIDIDNFKKINDNYGHLAGDYILTEFATALKNGIRSYDILARFGGEEFIILFFDCTRDMTEIILKRIHGTVESSIYSFDGNNIKVTFSAGITSLDEMGSDDFSLNDILKLADEKLYRAKESGRNRIVT